MKIITMDYKTEFENIINSPIPNFSKLLEINDIVLYGAGSLGKMAVDLLNRIGIKPLYIVDKKENHDIQGIPVVLPEKINIRDKKEAVFLICISTVSYNEINEYLKSLGIINTIQFYTWFYYKKSTLLSNGFTLLNPTEDEKTKMLSVCDLLKDDKNSLNHYFTFLWWKIRQVERIYDGYPILSGKKYWFSPTSKKLNDSEIFIDLGSHFGQTIEKFIEITNNHFSHIYAFEPDGANLEICKSVNKNYSDSRISYYQLAVSNYDGEGLFENGLGFASKLLSNSTKEKIKVIKLDSLKLEPTLIKIHIEGEELRALEGAKQTLMSHKPFVMCLADHNSDGLFEIPLFLYSLGYRLSFSLHDYCGNSAVWYANID